MTSPSSRLAALTLWIAAASVAIALLGSSTLLFPGPNERSTASSPPGEDVVARVVAPLLGPAERTEPAPSPPPAAPAESSPAVAGAAPLGVVPSGVAPVAEPNPVRGVVDPAPTRPGPDGPVDADRKDKDKADHKARKARGVGAVKDRGATGPPSHAVAGEKSQRPGPIRLEPPRGPKHSHVRPAKAHGKSGGGPPPHARKGGKRK
jgi:hypothetical protein